MNTDNSDKSIFNFMDHFTFLSLGGVVVGTPVPLLCPGEPTMLLRRPLPGRPSPSPASRRARWGRSSRLGPVWRGASQRRPRRHRLPPGLGTPSRACRRHAWKSPSRAKRLLSPSFVRRAERRRLAFAAGDGGARPRLQTPPSLGCRRQRGRSCALPGRPTFRQPGGAAQLPPSSFPGKRNAGRPARARPRTPPLALHASATLPRAPPTRVCGFTRAR